MVPIPNAFAMAPVPNDPKRLGAKGAETLFKLLYQI